MKVEHFYNLSLAHLRSRQREVAFLNVSVGSELWLSCETAALLDRNREACGIGGTNGNVPTWTIAPEYKKIDLWVAPHATDNTEEKATALEYKLVFNNKNFWSQVRQIRLDLNKELPETAAGEPERFGILLAVFKRYRDDINARYSYLRWKGQDYTAPEFFNELHDALAANEKWYGEAPALEVLRDEEVCTLDEAPYIEAGHGSAVRLLLVRRK